MYGIHPKLIDWIGSFLSDRSIQVRVDGALSDDFGVNPGVAQGCVISPILFLLYINDLFSSINSSIHSFADDTTIHHSSSYTSQRSSSLKLTSDRTNTSSLIEQSLADVANWGSCRAVSFNPSKSVHLSISRHSSRPTNTLNFNSSLVPRAELFSLLGLTISSNLSWNAHIKIAASRAAKKLGFLFRARLYFTSEQLLLLYKAQIRPTLEYCCHVWGGAPAMYLNLLDRIQRKAIRLIGDSSLTSSLQSLGLRRNVACLSLFYRYYHGKCSTELANIVPRPLTFSRSTRLQSSSHCYQVTIPRCRTSYYASSFFPRISGLWNSLPLSCFPPSYNLQSFKKSIFVHLATSC